MGWSPHLTPVPGSQLPLSLGGPKRPSCSQQSQSASLRRYRLVLGCRISSLAYQRPRNLGFLLLRTEHSQGACFRWDLAFERGGGCQLLTSFQLSGKRLLHQAEFYLWDKQRNSPLGVFFLPNPETSYHFFPSASNFAFFLVWIHTCFSASLNTVQKNDTSLPNFNLQSKCPSTLSDFSQKQRRMPLWMS